MSPHAGYNHAHNVAQTRDEVSAVCVCGRQKASRVRLKWLGPRPETPPTPLSGLDSLSVWDSRESSPLSRVGGVSGLGPG